MYMYMHGLAAIEVCMCLVSVEIIIEFCFIVCISRQPHVDIV